uniref:Uncharacterized protein n=1 Tax=Ceratitis capitata TaxID=7213 RepID=W8AZR2_CERCA
MTWICALNDRTQYNNTHVFNGIKSCGKTHGIRVRWMGRQSSIKRPITINIGCHPIKPFRCLLSTPIINTNNSTNITINNNNNKIGSKKACLKLLKIFKTQFELCKLCNTITKLLQKLLNHKPTL